MFSFLSIIEHKQTPSLLLHPPPTPPYCQMLARLSATDLISVHVKRDSSHHTVRGLLGFPQQGVQEVIRGILGSYLLPSYEAPRRLRRSCVWCVCVCVCVYGWVGGCHVCVCVSCVCHVCVCVAYLCVCEAQVKSARTQSDVQMKYTHRGSIFV